MLYAENTLKLCSKAPADCIMIKDVYLKYF